MLIVRDAAGRVLLERRPPSGIWGRLWSLPECATADDARDALQSRHALAAEMISTLATFSHTFSHFRLQITPLILRAAVDRRHVADDPDRAWFGHADLPNLGLPAPVRKLLDNLPQETSSCEPCTA